MKRIGYFQLFTFLFILITFTSCDIIGDIFEAGFWVGIILLVVVVLIIGWLINKFRGGGGRRRGGPPSGTGSV